MTNPSFRDFVLDQLGDSVEVVCRPMFGGHGLYAGGAFFAIIFKERLYFRTNESSRSAYVRDGMHPFHPRSGMALKSYYEVPADVLEDADKLTKWAQVALMCAVPVHRSWRRGRESRG